MARAILVLGPEGSGTRWLTSLFIAAGCAGTAEHEQPFDRKLPAATSPIVIRRSVPYWGRWPNITNLVHRLTEHGFNEVRAAVILRDWHATRHSQVAAGHVPDVGTAEARMQQAIVSIFSQLHVAGVPFVWVTYEGLVARPEQTVAWLMPRFGLDAPAVYAIDGNRKYYEGKR